METHLLLGGVLYHLVDTCYQGELCLLLCFMPSFKAPTRLTLCSFMVSAASCVSRGRFLEPVVPPTLDRNSCFLVRSVGMAELLSPSRDS